MSQAFLPVFAIVVIGYLVIAAFAEFSDIKEGTLRSIVDIINLLYFISTIFFIDYILIVALDRVGFSILNNLLSVIIAGCLGLLFLLYMVCKHYIWFLPSVLTVDLDVSKMSQIIDRNFLFLSDIHLSEIPSVEFGEDPKLKKAKLASILNDIKDSYRVLISLGDNTDTGDKAQWLSFNKAFEGTDFVFPIPGNHDITFMSPTVPRWWKKKNFVAEVVAKYYVDCEVLTKSEWKVKDFFTVFIGRKINASYIFENIFPLIIFEDPKNIIVALNTCTEHGIDMLSSGFGRVGKKQLSKLERLSLPKYNGKDLIIVMHHPIGVTNAYKQGLSKLERIQLKFLKLKDAKQVLQVVKKVKVNFNTVTVVNGHLHKKADFYHCGIHIMSAPSMDVEKSTADNIIYL